MRTLLTLIFFVASLATYAQDIDSSKLLNDIRTLSSDDFEGRSPGSKGHTMANNYVSSRFKKLQLTPFSSGYQQLFTLKDSTKGFNIVGYIQGKTDSAIVISAHYDHVGIQSGKIFNGADDNASGTAALLSFIQYFKNHKNPYYTLIFAAFDAEEKGLLGAKAFVANPPIPISKIVLNVNMDMISRNDKNELYACGTTPYPFLKKYIVSANNFVQLKTGHDLPNTGHDNWINQSDQGAFHSKNIPFIYFGVEDHPDYHTPNDKFENIQPGFFYNASLSILNILKTLIAQPIPR